MSKLRQKPSPDGLPSEYEEITAKYGTYLTIGETMEVMKRSRPTIIKLIRAKKLKAKKVQNRWTIAAVDIVRAGA